jgi:hypothetical protein
VRVLVGVGALGMAGLLVGSTLDAVTRGDGYDVFDHWISLLALGDRGLLGTATIALGGIAVLVGSWGFARAMAQRPGGAWTARALALLGVSMIAVAVFPVDPVPTYPPGVPVPSTPTLDARLHAFFGTTTLAALCALGWFGVRWSKGRAGLQMLAGACASVCAASVLACVALVAAKGGQRWDAAFAGLFQRAAMASMTVWVGALAIDQQREPRPAATSTPVSVSGRATDRRESRRTT